MITQYLSFYVLPPNLKTDPGFPLFAYAPHLPAQFAFRSKYSLVLDFLHALFFCFASKSWKKSALQMY